MPAIDGLTVLAASRDELWVVDDSGDTILRLVADSDGTTWPATMTLSAASGELGAPRESEIVCAIPPGRCEEGVAVFFNCVAMQLYTVWSAADPARPWLGASFLRLDAAADAGCAATCVDLSRRRLALLLSDGTLHHIDLARKHASYVG